MENPELVCIKVIVREGRKLFEDGKKPAPYRLLSIGQFGSWHDGDETETPCLLFRKGVYFDSATLAYVGSRSDGYHLFMGFRKLGIPVDTNLWADAFEEGDVIAFVRTLHPSKIKPSASQT